MQENTYIVRFLGYTVYIFNMYPKKGLKYAFAKNDFTSMKFARKWDVPENRFCFGKKMSFQT